MKEISEILGKSTNGKKPPAHELAASVEHVMNVIGFHGKYDWPYWSKKLQGKKFGEVIALVKEAKSKRDPGSWLSWKVKNERNRSTKINN